MVGAQEYRQIDGDDDAKAEDECVTLQAAALQAPHPVAESGRERGGNTESEAAHKNSFQSVDDPGHTILGILHQPSVELVEIELVREEGDIQRILVLAAIEF